MVIKLPALFATLLLAGLALGACGSGPDASTLTEQEALGQRLFTQNCASCHAQSTDAVIVGPSMAGIGERAASRVPGMDGNAYIVESILDPAAYINEGFDNLMPDTFGQTLTSEELEAMVAYLLLLE